MLNWKNLTGYEKVQIYNFIGYCNYTVENLRGATQAYENVLAQGADAPLGIQQSILQTISSIYLQQENYSKALDSIARLMRIVPDPTAELWVLKGQAHYQAGQYGQVIEPINRAIQMYRAQGKNPKENWLLMSRHAAYEKGDYRAMSGFIRELIRFYPKESYISQLAGAYSQAGDNKKFLALTEVLYEGGYKTDASTIKNLSQLYLMQEVPYKTGKLMQKEMQSGRLPNNLENKKLLATALFQARSDQKAIPVLKEAADQSRDPELYVRLTQSYMNVDNFDGCISASKNALNYGVKNRKAANTMLGMCYLNQEKLDEARAAFVAAGGARNWLNYIDNELKRRQKLEQDIDMKKIEKNELLESIESS
jgi:tetratricopeptide (TPR) repeat protein